MLDTLPDRALRLDSLAGAKLGVDGTPTFVINDLVVPGFADPATFRSYVKRAISAGSCGNKAATPS